MLKLLTFLFFFFSLFLQSQEFRLYNWQALTSHRSFRDATIDTNYNIWCATSGGIAKLNFNYNRNLQTFTLYDNTKGLSSVDYSAITVVWDKNIIIAGNNKGNIDLIFDNGKILNVYDIANANFINKEIKDIINIDGKCYIGGAFGLVEFFPNKNGDTFEQTFGDSYRLVSVNKIQYFGNDTLYIATEQNGVQYISLKDNLSDPKNWKSINKDNGLPTNNISDVYLYKNELYFTSGKQLIKKVDSTYQVIKQFDYDVNGFFQYDLDLYVDDQFVFRNISNTKSFSYFGNDTITGSIHNRVFVVNDAIFLLSEFEGLIDILNFKVNRKYTPKTSYSNAIYDMEVDSKGNLWATTGVRGFMKYDGEEWTYFNSFIKNNEGKNIPINAYKSISINQNDDIYLGYRGQDGQLVMKNNNGVYDYLIYNESNSGFVGVDPTKPPSFFEAAETQFDRNGVAWTVNWADFYPGPFLVAEDNGKFYAFNNCIGVKKRGFMRLAIDNSGTKWVGADQSNEREGIVLYNENGTLADKSDDICMNLKTDNVSELANNTITSLVLDKNGWIWAGTPTGITYFLNPSAATYDDNPNSLIAVRPSVFQDFAVNHIYVDALNYKWISTSKGLYVYNADATKQVAFINSSNSALPTDDVKNVTINERTGEVYIATILGLYKANSISVKPSSEYDITCYPQPFKPEQGSLLTIEGLAGKSDIRIITPNGFLIKQIDAIGDKIFWDGKDGSGNFVKSGVYLILASSGIENIQSVQKIAIINNK